MNKIGKKVLSFHQYMYQSSKKLFANTYQSSYMSSGQKKKKGGLLKLQFFRRDKYHLMPVKYFLTYTYTLLLVLPTPNTEMYAEQYIHLCVMTIGNKYANFNDLMIMIYTSNISQFIHTYLIYYTPNTEMYAEAKICITCVNIYYLFFVNEDDEDK